jgi:membrane protease YdiL (CAAX protease family)
MLSAKAWKPDAIMRLLLSVFVCTFAGSLLPSLRYGLGPAGTVTGKLLLALAVVSIGSLVATLVLINKTWRLETFERQLIAVLVCFCVGSLAGAGVQHFSGERTPDSSPGRILMVTLTIYGAGLILVARFLREHQMSWAEGFGLKNHRGRAVLVGMLIALLFLPVGWGLQQASAQVMTHLPHLKLQPQEQVVIHALRVAASSWWDRLALGVTAILLAPVAEEIFFRGVLYPAIKQAGFPRVAWWGTALFFAVVHVNLVTFVPLTVLALALIALYERTDNLLAPITAHAMFNALNFTTLLLLEGRMGG